MKGERNTYFWLSVLFMVQALLLLIFTLSAHAFTSGAYPGLKPAMLTPLLLVLVGIYIPATFVVVQELYKEAGLNAQLRAQARYMDNVNDLISRVRAQRHDFVNHVQALYGLIHTRSYDEAVQYIDGLLGETRQTGDLLRIKPLEVGALLNAKLGLAEARGVQLQVRVAGDVSSVPVGARDMNRLLGNFIDNALDALEGLPETERWIRVEMAREPEWFVLKVANGGPPIPEDMQKKIFQAGFSTKSKETHSGLGLYAVQEVARRYGGRVELVSRPGEGTTFTVRFPAGKG